jgi:hypothetical protein
MLPRLLVCILIIAALLVPTAGQAQEPDIRTFGDSGYAVRGDFLQFFNLRGRLEVFGPPISAEMFEDGVRVQYFRNVRLEWHPENPRPYRVQLGLLGELVGVRQPPIAQSQLPPANRLDERYYAQTGHTVKGGFLSFFDQHGGIDLFGYPIGEMEPADNNRVIQSFQRARLELHPDNSGGQIVLAPLGDQAFKKKHPDIVASLVAAGTGVLGTPPPPQTIRPQMSLSQTTDASSNLIVLPSRPTSVQVSASLKNSITGGGDASTQRAFVYVTDDQNNPLPNAEVTLSVEYPFGQQDFQMPLTDPSGLTSLSFEVGRIEAGLTVVVKAQASYSGQAAVTETSFLSWY